MQAGATIEWSIARWFPENLPRGSEFTNPKPLSSKQINSNLKQDHIDLMMGNVGKSSVNFMLTVPTNLMS